MDTSTFACGVGYRIRKVKRQLDGGGRALREAAGLARRARGWIGVRGAEAAGYLQGQLTNRIEALEPGKGTYSAPLDRKGRMQADMRVLCICREETLIECEPEALAAS